MFMKKIKGEYYTDILIIGGGAAGFGAANSAGRMVLDNNYDISVTLIEKTGYLGGTSTYGGVNCWEPGVSGNGVHFEIADELLKTKKAGIGGYEGVVCKERPYSLSVIHDEYRYEDTLKRLAVKDFNNLRRFHFEPDAMDEIMKRKLSEKNVKVLYNSEFTDFRLNGRNIESVYIKINGEIINIKAKVFIDCTGNIQIARAVGCKYMRGEDSKDEFGEYLAPDEHSDTLNGATLLFRAEKCVGHIDEIPEMYKKIYPEIEEWYKNYVESYRIYSQCNYYPNGDLNINMLPTMDGKEFFEYDKSNILNIMKTRLWYYLVWLQKVTGFDYKMKYIFPYPSAREDYRLHGRYVLTEIDLRKGAASQYKKEEIIAFADHDLDIHGKNNVNIASLPRLENPYGIPYSCLLPNEIDNMLVACRGSSFTHIAASSCRLTRTMIATGEAAGSAAVLSINKDVILKNINTEDIQEFCKINLKKRKSF